MTIIRISGKNEKKVDETCEKIFNIIERAVSGTESINIFPPEEPPLSRIKSRIRKNITIISPKTAATNTYLKKLLASLSSPPSVAITFDVDAVNET